METTVNEEKLNEFLGKMVGDLGAAMNSSLVLIGDKLGLYRAIYENGPLTATELAQKTGTSERYIREWLAAQAASGYVNYSPEHQTFSMSPEQGLVFADPESPVLMPGGFYVIASVFADYEKLMDAFRTGEGISWGDHNNCLFCGTEKFFRPSYKANLVHSWIPALEGVEEKLKAGIKVADIGCGHGASTLIMAEAYPNSEFIGIDLHAGSIAHANKLLEASGLSNVRFVTADAREFAGEGFGFAACFDCLHDMGDPVGVAGHIRETLTPDGTWMIVEPFANDTLTDNLNPVGRVYYSASTALCVPSSLSQPVGKALGAQAGEKRIGEVVAEGGFRQFRRAAETPFNLIFEARL